MNKYSVITNKYILESVLIKSLNILDSGWGSWNSWSSCLKTCGEDVKKIRYRSCENPDPKYGGRDCPGANYEYGLCSPQPEICRSPNATCNSGKVFLEAEKDLTLPNTLDSLINVPPGIIVPPGLFFKLNKRTPLI